MVLQDALLTLFGTFDFFSFNGIYATYQKLLLEEI